VNVVESRRRAIDTARANDADSTISTKRHRVRVPEIPMYLDALLADQPLISGLSQTSLRQGRRLETALSK
jgi:hypothetical protein